MLDIEFYEFTGKCLFNIKKALLIQYQKNFCLSLVNMLNLVQSIISNPVWPLALHTCQIFFFHFIKEIHAFILSIHYQ